MRVRVLSGFTDGGRVFRAGEAVDIGIEAVDGLLDMGLVMQDKSLDGATDTKDGADGGDRWQ